MEDDEPMPLEQSEPELIDVNSFTYRTHNCGQLREENIGQSVILCGWLEYHRVGKFVILRDGYGRTQLIIPEEVSSTIKNISLLINIILNIFISAKRYTTINRPFAL